MSLSIFTDPLFGLFADPEITAAFAPQNTLRLYGLVEMALADALAAEGLASEADAAAIRTAAAGFVPDLAALTAASARDGIPLPGYVAQLRAKLPEPHAAALHRGATSQDIMDTALMLALRDVNAVFAARLSELLDVLTALQARWGEAPLMARTRMQAALPVTAGHRIALWRQPLADLAPRLDAVRHGLEVVQLGGPVGTRGGWEGRGDALAARVAAALGLRDPGAVWHTDRTRLADYAAFLAALSAALGKIGADVTLMAQQGVDEISLAGGGGSSAMGHKKNPVAAELLVTLARFNAGSLGGFGQSLVHEQERSGTAWALEWMILPQMCAAAGVGLLRCGELLRTVERIGTPRTA